MAGEISNLYGSSSYNNYNPYSANSDDFLAQQYFAQNPQVPQQGSNPMFTGYSQPQADTFQKSGGSGLGTGLLLGSVAGLGTGAGMYFWGTNPVKDGKVNDDLVKVVLNNDVKDVEAIEVKKLYAHKAKPVLNRFGVSDMEQYDAIQKLSKASKLEDLSDDVKNLLPDTIKTPKDAQDLIAKAKPELDKIDKQKILKQVEAFSKNEFSLEHNTAQLEKLKNIEAKIKTLKTDATKADIEKFLIDNAETFKLKGTNTEIAAKARKIADKLGSQEELLKVYQGHIARRTQNINDLKAGAEAAIKDNLDDAGKALKNNADEDIAKAFKNFKWNKTLKYGGVAAAAGLALGWLFGGSSSKKA